MRLPRIIPCLLLEGGGFYKTTRFKNPVYLGDPVNILKIFNDKEVDEIVILDTGVRRDRREPNFELLEDMASECFMPLAYGGGVQTIQHIRKLFRIGFEKVVINSAAHDDPSLVREAADAFGSQSIVVSMDVKKTLLGKYEVLVDGGRRRTQWRPEAWAEEIIRMGAGEILVTSIDRDGTMSGYDHNLTQLVARVSKVPVIASGGASGVHDLVRAAKESGASACAAGALFVFQGKHRAVLINVPSREEIQSVLNQ